MKKLISVLSFLALVLCAQAQFLGYELYVVQLWSDATGADYVAIDPPTDTTPGDVDGILFWNSSLGTNVGKWHGYANSAAFVVNKTNRTIGIDYVGLVNKPTLGTASTQATGFFATAAQGAKADSALQSVDIGVSLQAYIANGSSSQYLRGDGTKATSPTNLSAFTNGPGYIASISSGNVTTALGFTPYNATNPSAYVTSSGARSAISLTTTGTSGAATYDSGTGVLNMPQYAAAARSFNNAPSAKTIQTVAASANGFQVSSTRDSNVTYSITIVTATTLGGGTNVSGYVVLEIAATNSATAGDWSEVGRVPSGQNNALTVALGTLTQTAGGSVHCLVPAGYYARLRSVNSNGTPTYTYNSGQEVLL